ncbi:MAG TPA: aminopeptidase N, partial [Candidatus Corynebacterium gallistercoris]|nr:aminopeptidase N [Candidatus Corynebacterium gallistercoris]
MTSLNLTRTEAAARAELISNVHYSIDLDLSGGQDAHQRLFDSVTTVRFTSGAGSTFLDLRAEEVARVTVDGQDVTASAVPVVDGRYDAAAGIQLEALTEGDHEVVVAARIPYSTTGQGLHRFFDPADDETYMYTQFETADAKRVFACFDQPDLKATYSVQLTTPAAWTVVTNNVVTTEEAGEGLVRHTSEVDYLLSTYLVAFCVGPWYVVRDEWSGTVTEHEEFRGEGGVAAKNRGEL